MVGDSVVETTESAHQLEKKLWSSVLGIHPFITCLKQLKMMNQQKPLPLFLVPRVVQVINQPKSVNIHMLGLI